MVRRRSVPPSHGGSTQPNRCVQKHSTNSTATLDSQSTSAMNHLKRKQTTYSYTAVSKTLSYVYLTLPSRGTSRCQMLLLSTLLPLYLTYGGSQGNRKECTITTTLLVPFSRSTFLPSENCTSTSRCRLTKNFLRIRYRRPCDTYLKVFNG
jgi:hypothetical protein